MHDDKHKNIDTIIRQILSGEADENDEKIFYRWLDASEKNRKSFEILKNVWENQWDTNKLSNTDELSKQLWHKATSTELNIKQIRKAFPWEKFLKAAAVVIIIVSGVLVYQENQIMHQVEKTEALTVIKENPPGQKSKIILPDSTVIWLNAASSLTYQKPFADSIRSVELIGEAYFEVAEDTKRPFVVKTGRLYTTALGTSFNISNYDDRKHVGVALLTGKVKVEDDQHQSQFLEPGEGLAFDKASKKYADFTIDMESIIAWKNGVLVFNDDDFESVKFKLEKWYGVDITYSGVPPQNWKLQGRYDGVYLDDLLDNIKYNKGFTYSLDGKRLMIKF